MKRISLKSVILILSVLFYMIFLKRLYSTSEEQNIITDELIKNEKNLNLNMNIYNSKMKMVNSIFPYELFNQTKYDEIIEYFRNKYDKDDCKRFPNLSELKFNNVYWQELQLSSGETDFMYKAYYDDRAVRTDTPSIHIIAHLNTKSFSKIKYCKIWFPNELIISEVISTHANMNKPRGVTMRTFVITCKIPELYSSLIPKGVSLLENECDVATNLLAVNYNLPDNGIKEGVAVCIKALDYPHEDMSMYFIQWLEILDILGFRKVIMYDYGVHPALQRVLQYYQSLDRIDVIPLTNPGTTPHLFGLMHNFLLSNESYKASYEKISRNDCLYMNMHKYKYIVFQDVDEILIPNNGKSIDEMFDFINSKYNAPSGYRFDGAVFTEELLQKHGLNPNIPSYMSLLQQVYRRGMLEGKTALNMEAPLMLADYFMWTCVGNCTRLFVPNDIGFIHHHRKGEKGSYYHTDDLVNDTIIWSYKDELITRVHKVLKTLNLKPV